MSFLPKSQYKYVYAVVMKSIEYDEYRYKQDKYTMNPRELNLLQQFCRSIKKFWTKIKTCMNYAWFMPNYP